MPDKEKDRGREDDRGRDDRDTRRDEGDDATRGGAFGEDRKPIGHTVDPRTGKPLEDAGDDRDRAERERLEREGQQGQQRR
jgi:hypothetical protein